MYCMRAYPLCTSGYVLTPLRTHFYPNSTYAHFSPASSDLTEQRTTQDCMEQRHLQIARHNSFHIASMMQVPMLLRFSLICGLASVRVLAWNVDERCLRGRQLDSIQMEGKWIEELEIRNEVITEDEKEFRQLTRRELQSSYRFKLRMHWQLGYCWQDEWIERFWCAQCVGTSCNEGDVLNVRACKRGVAAQEFTWIPTKGGGRLKVARKDLCLERTGTNEFELRNCSSTLLQVLVGFNPYRPFEISPFGNAGKKCFTQDHHPTPHEVLFTATCDAARRTNTSLWEVYQETGKYDPTISPFTKWLTNRNSTCIPSNPCPECTGNCAKDTDCMGTLKCQKRMSSNPLAPIPGCMGTGSALWGYCSNSIPSAAPAVRSRGPTRAPAFGSRGPIASPTVSSPAPTAARKPLVFPIRTCTVDSPCDECQGDCRYDLDCKGDLVCFQKDGSIPIPGCVGDDKSRTDWCVDPKNL